MAWIIQIFVFSVALVMTQQSYSFDDAVDTTIEASHSYLTSDQNDSREDIIQFFADLGTSRNIRPNPFLESSREQYREHATIKENCSYGDLYQGRHADLDLAQSCKQCRNAAINITPSLITDASVKETPLFHEIAYSQQLITLTHDIYENHFLEIIDTHFDFFLQSKQEYESKGILGKGILGKDNVRKQAPPKGLPTGPFT